jgi:hypothetical protein
MYVILRGLHLVEIVMYLGALHSGGESNVNVRRSAREACSAAWNLGTFKNHVHLNHTKINSFLPETENSPHQFERSTGSAG